jgi:formyltetrahydrofolate synthetase
MMSDNEGIPWFWKIFGPALVGFVGVLLAIILNAIHSNTIQCRMELVTSIVENKKQIDGELTKIKDLIRQLEVKVATMEEFKASAKEKLNSNESLVKEKNQISDSTLSVIRQNEKEFSERVLKIEEKMLKLEEKLLNVK